jgi:hypothetical protein
MFHFIQHISHTVFESSLGLGTNDEGEKYPQGFDWENLKKGGLLEYM